MASEDINVIVVIRKGRKYLYLRYTDPVTGQKVEKSAGTSSKREAVKAAGRWQSELENGQAVSSNRLRWDAFREAYLDFAESRMAEGSVAKIYTMFNIIERTMKPDSVRRVQPKWITRFQSELLKSGNQPSTVEGYCRHLKAALNWAKSQALISTVPPFPRLKRSRSAKLMKGRPVTGEEFDRMLASVETTLKPMQHESIRFLLRGLWLSGLRLSESLCLTWDQWADGIRVDMSGKWVKLLIPSESEKGGKDRVYPVTPDFAEFLLSVPAADRVGFVFNPVCGNGPSRNRHTVGRVAARIGEAAGVKVDEKDSTASYASSHDLRRAFGTRWSRRVSSSILKELMRHETVLTTEKYYIDIDADSTAAMLAGLMNQGDTSGLGDTLGDTSKESVRQK